MKVQEEIGKEIDGIGIIFFIMHLSKIRLKSICAIGLKCKKLL